MFYKSRFLGVSTTYENTQLELLHCNELDTHTLL